MSAAIFFHPEAYSTAVPILMGRNSTGESFLRGFLAHSVTDAFWTLVNDPKHVRVFAEAVRKAGRTEPVHGVSRQGMAKLAEPGALFYPGPDIANLAWQRASAGRADWSLCGVTYTLSSAAAMDGLAQLLVAPVQPWDALICASEAGRAAVLRLWDAQAGYLSQRLGASRFVQPQMPVIPLGIHTADFAFNEAQRQAAREVLGADARTHVVLFTGRLSFHAKAHPLAMYQALERAAAELPVDERLLLVECGKHANPAIGRAFAEAARAACPSVRVLSLDGREGDNYQHAWAGADVFCSLSDNLQETFGLTPIEAMAAGLPVVVSDWDGYKDTVRDGVDGFRIPTLMPAGGLGGDLALRHATEVDTYDMYCGHTCSLVAVDVAATARAFARLFASPALRRQMGASGRQRAREVYDWSVVIAQYEALWAQLAELRKAGAGAERPTGPAWPARMDPFEMFAAYPTRVLERQTLLARVDADAATAIQRFDAWRALTMVKFAQAVFPSAHEVHAVIEAASTLPQPAETLVRDIPAERQAFVFRALAALLKLGILKTCD